MAGAFGQAAAGEDGTDLAIQFFGVPDGLALADGAVAGADGGVPAGDQGAGGLRADHHRQPEVDRVAEKDPSDADRDDGSDSHCFQGDYGMLA